jgi:hypothetical protein
MEDLVKTDLFKYTLDKTLKLGEGAFGTVYKGFYKEGL